MNINTHHNTVRNRSPRVGVTKQQASPALVQDQVTLGRGNRGAKLAIGATAGAVGGALLTSHLTSQLAGLASTVAGGVGGAVVGGAIGGLAGGFAGAQIPGFGGIAGMIGYGLVGAGVGAAGGAWGGAVAEAGTRAILNTAAGVVLGGGAALALMVGD